MKITESDLVQDIAEVFRMHGYDGASMTEFSRATGLQRASLYHRFPEGKAQMATSVVEALGNQLMDSLNSLIENDALPFSRKMEQLVGSFRSFYRDGKLPCLIDAMSFDLESREHAGSLRGLVDGIHAKLARLGKQSGLSDKSSKEWASEILIRIQGSLVLSRALGQPEIFQSVLNDLATT